MRKDDILHILSIVFLAAGVVFTALNLFKKTKNERNPLIALLFVSLSSLMTTIRNYAIDDEYCYDDCDCDCDCDCGFCD